MKKRITKLMSTLLCCVMLLGLFPTAAFAGAIRGGDQPGETAPDAPAATDLPTAYTVQCVTEGAGHTAVSVNQIADTASIGTVSQSGDSYVCPITVSTLKYADAYSAEVGKKHSAVNDSIFFHMTWKDARWVAPAATSLPAIDVECEYGVTYSYDNSVPAEVMATLPTNSYNYSVGQMVTTAAKPEDVTVGDYIWKFRTWQLNGVDVAPNTQIEMVQGGLTFTGVWTREAVMSAEYGVTYRYDNSVPAVVMATLPTNSYTYSVGQKVTTAAKPEDVVVGDYVWKFQTWQLNGVDVAPNTQIEMVQGGLTFTGVWTREAVMSAEYGVTYRYDNSVPAVVMATLPTNSYTYSVGQKVTTAAKPEDVVVGDYVWKFQTWQLNGVDVAPNTQIEMVQGGLTFTGVWTREAVKPAEYGVTYSYDNSVPAEVMATLPTNSYTYSVGQKVTTAAKPEDVTVGDYIWKFQTWQLNGVDVAPNTQIEMVQGGLTFTGVWTREAVKPAEYGVTYSYDNSVPAEVMATLPTNSYTYSVGQKVTTAAKPEDVTVGDYVWKFQTWQLNGVDVAPNTQIEMVRGGLTFTGIWTREAMMPAEYGVTYSYDNSVPAEVMATLPTNSYTYSVGQKVTTAAKPEDVTVGDYVWKFQTWQLNGVDVAPNTQIEMVRGGLTFTGIWTRE
ncbi:SHIRT domain-containing protein, partial [Intestinimonas massiliensis]